MAFVIRGGTLITAAETFAADILVEGERIAAIGPHLAVGDGVEVVDAAGKLVLPGGVDVHTHLELPMFGTVSSDDHYTGHKAAAFGGTTTAIDFISQDHALAAGQRGCLACQSGQQGGGGLQLPHEYHPF